MYFLLYLIFFIEHRSSTSLSSINESDFIKLLKLAVTSDIIFFKGHFYKQTSGLSMGNNLSPILAIIYMFYIESQILSNNPSRFILWKRYIDDIFVVSVSPLDNLLPELNSINDCIDYTVEYTFDSKIPFLDTMISFKE